MKNELDDVSKLVPLGSVFLILCSATKLVIYYNFFNIQIVDYLEFGEFLTLFIDDILYYLMVLSIGIISYFILGDPVNEEDDKTNKTTRKVLYIIFTIVLVVALLWSILASTASLRTYIVGTSIIFLLNIVHSIFHTIKITRFTSLHRIILSILIFTITFGYAEGYTILEKGSSLKYKLLLNKKVIFTTTNCWQYLGKTKNYYYFYNLKSKESAIISTSELDQVSINKNGS